MTDSQQTVLSVVVPTHNDAANLQHCLTALRLSTPYASIEIIVIDDGSTDDTSSVTPPTGVRWIRFDENHGQSAARNHGAALARSDWILFVDSDVVLPPLALDRTIQFIAAARPETVGFKGRFALEHPHPDWSSRIYNTVQHLLTHHAADTDALNTSCLLIRKDTFQQLGGFDESLWFMEDTDFGNRLARSGHRLEQAPFSFLHRKHASWSWLIRAFFLSGQMLRTLQHRSRQRRISDLPARKHPALSQSGHHHLPDTQSRPDGGTNRQPPLAESANPRIQPHPSDKPGASQDAGRPSRVFIGWLTSGLVLTAAVTALACAVGFDPQRWLADGPAIRSHLFRFGWFSLTVAMATAAAALLATSARALYDARRNPVFVFIGLVTMLAIPWLIAAGRAWAAVRAPGRSVKDRWRHRSSRASLSPSPCG